MTNEDDNARFDRHFEEYAEAVVRGICKAVGVAYADKPAETPKEEMMTVSRAKWEAVRAALQAAQKALNEVV